MTSSFGKLIAACTVLLSASCSGEWGARPPLPSSDESQHPTASGADAGAGVGASGVDGGDAKSMTHADGSTSSDGANGDGAVVRKDASPNGSDAGTAPVDAAVDSRDGATCSFGFVSTLPADVDVPVSNSGCRCTRRPGPGNSFECPIGTDRSATAVIGPAGGTLTLGTGVSLQLVVPPKALVNTVQIRVTETSIPPPAGFVDWSPVYHFEPEDLVFQTPASVRIPWQSNSGQIGRQLAIYWSALDHTCALAPLSDNYINAGFNQGSTRRLGWTIVGYPQMTGQTQCP